MRVALVLVVLLAACGDNGGGGGDDTMLEPCEPPAAPLPTTGMYIDPLAIPLEGCVEDGLRDMPGRWFVSDPMQYFQFDYPMYDGTCETGFRRHLIEDDLDPSDGYSLFSWSDGTRYFQREAYEFEDTVFVFVTAACMTSKDAVAVTEIAYDNERGERLSHQTGKRFGPMDELAVGLTLVGELGMAGSSPIVALNLVIDGTLAYIAGFDGMDIIDISNPAAPKPVGHFDGAWNDIRVVNDGTNVVAFLSPRNDDPTAFVDVTNPAAPTLLGMLQEYSHSLQIQERGGKKEMYLATYNESVPRYDVTAPKTPVRSGMAIVPGEVSGVHDLWVAGDMIYANNTTQGVVAFDTSGGFGTSNVEKGRFKLGYSHAAWAGMIGGRQVVLAGDEGMTRTTKGGAHLSILDGDPASATFMQEIGRYQTRSEVGIHYWEVVGNKVYIAYYHDGIRVIDLSNPTQPVEVAHYNTWDFNTGYGGAFEGALAVRKVGDYLYVADINRGLLILKEN
ncbi:MAG TPA: hypothetical protein VIV11_29910 [Kofleriaceae bacterium]